MYGLREMGGYFGKGNMKMHNSFVEKNGFELRTYSMKRKGSSNACMDM